MRAKKFNNTEITTSEILLLAFTNADSAAER